MSLQHAALQVMDHAARTLDGLAEEGWMADQARFAATRFRAAARSLSLEPLNLADIQVTRSQLIEAHPCLRKLYDDTKVDALQWGWVCSAAKSYEATFPLLDALKALHEHVTLDRPGIQSMPKGLKRLLPACWWGGL